MELQCESCGELFMSNTLLYKHKQIAHANLCTSSNSPASSITIERKRSSTDDDLKQSKLSKIELKSNGEDNLDYEMSYKVIDPTLKNEVNEEEIQIIDNQMNGKSCNVRTNSTATGHKSSGAGKLYESKFQCDSERIFKTEQLHDNDLIRIMESVYKTQIVQKLEHNIMNLKQKHKIEIAEIRQKYNDSLKEMEMQLEKEKSIHAWEITESASDDDDNDKEILSTLTKAINNTAAMSQVYEIQRLMEEGQINEILKKHFITFKNVLQSLTYGIIPLCQSQRDQVTNSQRNLVRKLQFSTKQTAAKLLKGRHSEIIKLFLIVKDSIKLIRISYNKYSR